MHRLAIPLRRSIVVAAAGLGAFTLQSRAAIHLDAQQPSSGSASPAVHSKPGSKLSIYPEPDPEIVLVETHSELERQIRTTRRHATYFYDQSRAHVRGIVSKWIGVEEAVENRIKSLIPKDESITPGILYVGVVALTGSVIGRTRSLPVRILLPPTLLILAFPQLLPKTSANLRAYFSSLEDHYVPDIAAQHDALNTRVSETLAGTCKKHAELTKAAKDSIQAGLHKLEETSGLKLGTKTDAK
ncbi:apolipo protein O-domain-containing protein [Cantharellus anzutake]|uniref:apolipo protein O-domain-containing protein n=1 Tax=Cantharellus anzutake TaxID=1750568 RepID=UPI001903CD86|nr:apolipo protein O-domain-containing protein [Cantharellus anzutake]KAF8332000.1 apolipo protein O-domain-containing protein [Cantharellus anzutake]